ALAELTKHGLATCDQRSGDEIVHDRNTAIGCPERTSERHNLKFSHQVPLQMQIQLTRSPTASWSSIMTFDSWFKRYEDAFKVELNHKDYTWRVRLLPRKLGTTEQYGIPTSYCQRAREISAKTVQKL
ncbi:hypothetical protein CSKR_101559, partial [Clonorchis sinensis]